jgi:serine protease Do
VLARDPQLDIAILQITDAPLDTQFTYVTFGDSESLQLGQTVVAIGNALGEFRNSVSVGVVSGLARSITATDGQGKTEQLDQVIQTDAAINPGNSGGPLLNTQGEVIGVNVATSRGADNIGFALPAHVVAQVVASVAKYGMIVRPYLGVRYVMIDERIQLLNKLPVNAGALVARGETREELAVLPGSPADRAGITENDIILSIDGEELRNGDLAQALREKKVGETVTLEVLQKGEIKTIRIVLEQTPE